MLELSLDTSLPQKCRALGHITRATLHKDPWASEPGLRDIFDAVDTFEREAHWGMVGWNADVAVLSFRGTDSNLEWAQTMSFGQVPWFEGRAHGGFVQALDTVWELVLASLYDANVVEEQKTLWVCGHSLGGALALLAADRLQRMGFQIHEAFIFGTPCVFDRVAAQAFAVPVHRVVNNEDPIPNMTWPTLFDTYECLGDEIFLLASGAVAESRHSHHLARKIDRANSIGEGILEAGLINDHFMREYVRKLDLWADSAPSIPQ